MVKRQTRKQIYADIANAVKQITTGQKVKCVGNKDGSIVTKPVVPCPDIPEAQVLTNCLTWLKKHMIKCDRMNVGVGAMRVGAMHTYGIPGAGDIVGLTRIGQHLEIECKAGKGGRLNAKQRKRMKDIRDNCGLYFVVHGVPELEFYFERIIDVK